MKLLLDTHVLLWWVTADRRLPKRFREAISDSANEILISAATFWELAIKLRLGRIDIDLLALKQAIAADGFTPLAVTIDHASLVSTLPDHHRDPFDRMLIAQAIASASNLVTVDEAIRQYAGHSGFHTLTL